ncbi:MAG: 6-carboxytetrahydropterin synthase QueD [Chitinophagales bacterium]
MEIYKVFRFESAHFLSKVSVNHKCRNLHGHSYKLTVFVKGTIPESSGWLIDFNDLKAAILPVIELVDHKLLNEIPGLENPTVENLAIWLWCHIKPKVSLLSKIIVDETATSGCIYEGE